MERLYFLAKAAPGLDAAVRRLCEYPLSGRVVPELNNRATIREVIAGAYRIVYRVAPNENTLRTGCAPNTGRFDGVRIRVGARPPLWAGECY